MARFTLTVSATVWRELARFTPEVRERFVEDALGDALYRAQVGVRAADGRALAPCHPARARELLHAGRAKLLRRSPPVIQLDGPGADPPSPSASRL
jgi:hypothetical protein